MTSNPPLLKGAKKKAARTLILLQERYPAPQTHLYANGPWELLVATILAAQCTDARVNTVTPALFVRWPEPQNMAYADIEELEGYIRPTGFYHNKAKSIIGAAKRICEVFAGNVPNTMADLITLPGVGRKTANVVLWGSFGINEGIAVDTHVGRIARRIGLTTETDPDRVEKDLVRLFPQKEWGDVNHRLVWFGRDVCRAAKPQCVTCEMVEFCVSGGCF